MFPQPVLSHLLEHQVYCSDKFVGTANRKPPFAVPTIFVGTVGPTNLSEQPIGNQFSVPTILVGTALFPLEVHFGVGGCGRTCAGGAGQE